jgi:hypothetical protein
MWWPGRPELSGYSVVPGMGVVSRLGITVRGLDGGMPACSALRMMVASCCSALSSSRIAAAGERANAISGVG